MKMAYEFYADDGVAGAALHSAVELEIVAWWSALGLTLTALFIERGVYIGQFLGMAG